MSSNFEDEFREVAQPELFDLYGNPATYIPHGGTSRVVTIVNTTRTTNRENLQGMRVSESMLTTYVSTDAVTGIPSPSKNDRLEYDGLTWSYVGINSRDHAGLEIAWRTTSDLAVSR